MPNYTRIPLCPFFRDEKKKSISCEDVFRSFSTADRKIMWMEIYCDEWDWVKCPYAVDLNEMYERISKGADMETEQMKQKIEAMKKELRHKATLLGRADKRLEAKDEEIKELRRKNKDLDEKRREEFKKRRKAEIELDKKAEKASEQLQEVITLYKNAFCYLLSKCPDMKIPEAEIKEWAEGKHFTVVRLYDNEGAADSQMMWCLDVFEETEADDKDTNTETKTEN